MADLLAWENLSLAVYKAARGKRSRPDVAGFLSDVDGNTTNLRDRIQSGSFSLDQYRRFQIMDPKPRNITALSFEMRVLHHAVMNLIGENLVRSQIHSSFACMPGRGVHEAARYVQRGLRRSEWYVKIDIEKYFERTIIPLDAPFNPLWVRVLEIRSVTRPAQTKASQPITTNERKSIP